MRIKKIQIKNFKSLVDFELEDLKPFCAFVGPNASGKSNIFEALEFANYIITFHHAAPKLFGGKKAIYSYNAKPINYTLDNISSILFRCVFADEVDINFTADFSNKDNEMEDGLFTIGYSSPENALTLVEPLELSYILDPKERKAFIKKKEINNEKYENDFEEFVDKFSRIFVGKTSLKRINQIQNKLAPDASNLSEVIGRIFENDSKRKDFIEWLRIIIPEFKNIEIIKNHDGSFNFSIYEKNSSKSFPIKLISDGTYNILALMAAVYQSNQPQFLCIEEPENGLHPHAIQLLVDFFREKCENEGHHIWLNTHSQTLVRCLEIDEIILVNKIDGETKVKQLTKDDNIDIKTDEAWLTNALGGGVLWSK